MKRDKSEREENGRNKSESVNTGIGRWGEAEILVKKKNRNSV